MRELLRESETAFILRPKASQTLAAWWFCLHAVLGSSLWLSGWPTYVKLGLTALIAAHWRGLRPRGAPLVIGSRHGPWALPERHSYNLELSSSTRFARGWVLLCLERPQAPVTSVLLLADQLPPEDWRRLQLALRERSFRVAGA